MNEEVRWTNLKTSDVVKLFAEKGKQISRFTIQQLTQAKGLGRRKMSKTLTIKEVENRAEQFHYIQQTVAEFKGKGLPILSIVKRRSLSGNFIGLGNHIAKSRSRSMTTIFRVWQVA